MKMTGLINVLVGLFLLLTGVVVAASEISDIEGGVETTESAGGRDAVKKAEVELGALFVGQISADYRGSDYYGARLLPLPYFMYRGPVIKADRGGVRGEFWRSYRFQLNISADGSLGGGDANSPLREGMPELESAIEFGPSLDVLVAGKSLQDGLSLRLPVRGVFTLGKTGVHHIGFLFNPRLSWRFPDVIGQWRLSFQAGTLFADRRYHDYYYGVDSEYVQSWRPYYRAESGYSGSYLKMNWYRSWDLWRFGVSFRYDHLAGASFTNSPLFESDHYGSISFALIRRFWSNYD